MKTLYLDLGMGAAGDMLSAALFELLPEEEKPGFIEELNGLGIPGVSFAAEKAVRCGVTGTRFLVTVDGEEEDEHIHEHHHEHQHEHQHEHEHEHDRHHEHDHHHEHHHAGLMDIVELVGKLAVSEKVRQDVLAVYALIAEAESHAHGVPVSAIHFHEVGTADAVADITAVCLLMERLAPGRAVASPIRVGSGTVRCAHGILPVPAPATAHILRGVPTYGGSIMSELCTPTGAALVRHFVKEFGPQPLMTVSAIGCGMGKKEFEQANCVRAMLGCESGGSETIIELSSNVDDMTAEEIGFASERLFEAGARDVFTTPVMMKKGRPGTLITVICTGEDRDKVLRAFFMHTSTLGVRESECRRHILSRRIERIETELGPVRRKVSEGFGAVKVKYEYEDVARIAKEKGVSFREALFAAEKAAQAKRDE